jgi:hypothetical protein
VLEVRTLLTGPFGANPPQPLPETEPNDVITQAQDLGTLDVLPAAVAGSVGNSPAGAADVDWYQFELAGPAHVTLGTQGGPAGSALVSALGLYESDPYHANPPLDPTSYTPSFGSPDGYHRLAEADGAVGQGAVLERDLAPGTYWVAVSGAGNRYFSPLLADSGQEASTGPYLLSLGATDLPATTGPVVLAADPAPGAAVASSPLLLRVNLSAPLAFQTVHLNQAPNTVPLDPVDDPVPTDEFGDPLPIPASVWLTYNPTGNFGDGNDQPVLLSGGDVNFAADELRLTLAAPRGPGYYQLVLAGDSGQHPFVVTDVNGNPLGADADHPLGQDVAYTFQVTGVEGQTGAGAAGNDTPATAQELGDVTHLVQVAGAIGDDPAFAAIPGADVDLYHFQVTGPGSYAFRADAFAARIGSPLDVALALYQLDPTDGQTLHLVYADDNTYNGSLAPDGFTTPLSSDAAVYAGLTAGDYYLAVSASGNTPDTAQGINPGDNGIYDLNAGTSYSGPPFLTTGAYVLNVLVQPSSGLPHVVATTPAEGTTLDGPPTQLQVWFDEPVQLQELAYRASGAALLTPGASPDALDAVFVRSANGTLYYPRLQSYDPATGVADFTLDDALPVGAYEFHLSGAQGLTDFAGDPLVGNDPSGDYVVHFAVGGGPRGTDGNPLLWTDQEPNGLDQPQEIGALFPRELVTGVVFQGSLGSTGASLVPDAEDDYVLGLLQGGQTYQFLLSTDSARLEVDDASGNPMLLSSPQDGLYLAALDAGTYRVRVLDAAPDQGSFDYQLTLTAQALPEAPTPLTVGPAPTFRIRLVTAPASPPTAPSSAGSGLSAGPPAPEPSAPQRLSVSLPPPSGEVTTLRLVSLSPLPARPTPDAGRPAAAAADTPASVLLALTAGPVGGVAGGSGTADASTPAPGDDGAAPDRLLVRGPELVARDRLLQVAILTGVDGAGNAGDAAPPPARAVVRVEGLFKGYASQALQSWRELLDLLFRAGKSAVEEQDTPVEPEDQDSLLPEDDFAAPVVDEQAATTPAAVGGREAPAVALIQDEGASPVPLLLAALAASGALAGFRPAEEVRKRAACGPGDSLPPPV